MYTTISANSVRRLLPASRQSNRKADEGSKHPDRDAQFEHINAKVFAAQAADQPVISVDTKKKELIGNYRNGGTDYRPKGDPRRVRVHDFEDKELGKVTPYGVYDVGAKAGWDHDPTALIAISAQLPLSAGGRRRRFLLERLGSDAPVVSDEEKMARMLSVNVGLPRDISWQGKTVHSGIWKTPVQGRRMVRRLNIDGDGQGDLQGHGGEHRAVFVYQID